LGLQENNVNSKYHRTLTRWQRLWRVNAGQGWAGRVIKRAAGLITIANARPFFGMPPGCPDNIGFDSIIITSDMVGKRVAVFVGTEVKATENDRLRPNQISFKELIVAMGGIHREVRSDHVIETKNF
jgi:hypothetical protein